MNVLDDKSNPRGPKARTWGTLGDPGCRSGGSPLTSYRTRRLNSPL